MENPLGFLSLDQDDTIVADKPEISITDSLQANEIEESVFIWLYSGCNLLDDGRSIMDAITGIIFFLFVDIQESLPTKDRLCQCHPD